MSWKEDDERGRQEWFAKAVRFFEKADAMLAYSHKPKYGSHEIRGQFIAARAVSGEALRFFDHCDLYYVGHYSDGPQTSLAIQANGPDEVVVRVAIDRVHAEEKIYSEESYSSDGMRLEPAGWSTRADYTEKGSQERIFRFRLICSEGAKEVIAGNPSAKIGHGLVKKSEWPDLWAKFDAL